MKKMWYLVAGLLFSISSYGYGSFALTTPLFVTAMIITEVLYNRLSFKKYSAILLVIIGLCIGYLPIFHQIATNPKYLQRINEKNVDKSSLISLDKTISIIKNYPKYYNPEFLFIKGEIGMPGAFITRHSVPGNGEYFIVALALIALSLITLFKKKDPQKRYILAPFIFFLLFPIPDALTTAANAPAYAFILFSSVIALPFMVCYGFQALGFGIKNNKSWLRYLYKILFSLILLLFIIESFNFFRNYQKYPLYSSNYWGWQWGFGDIIKYYQSVNNEYDDLYIAPLANGAEIFLPFYDSKKICTKCKFGGPVNYDSSRKQIFADEPSKLEEYNRITQFNTIKTLLYPNGTVAFYIISPTRID